MVRCPASKAPPGPTVAYLMYRKYGDVIHSQGGGLGIMNWLILTSKALTLWLYFGVQIFGVCSDAGDIVTQEAGEEDAPLTNGQEDASIYDFLLVLFIYCSY